MTEADGCGPGTILEDGQCVLADRNCGEGTTLDSESGVCVPAESLCGSGTTFDRVTETCVDDDEVTCDAGLVVDPDTGECIPSEEACDEGFEFDSSVGQCVAVSCEDGQVRVDEVCVDDGGELADDPDHEERENNDPELGGLAERLYLEPVDDDPVVFTGTIGEPEDFDGDGELDQDVDVYEFSAEEGSWLEVAVQSLGMPAPAFKIEGPDGFIRYSPVGRGDHAARQVVIPRDGNYTMTVLPELVLQTDADINLLGGDDWGYVGSIGQISVPEPTTVDVSSGLASLDGDVLSASDNFYRLDGTRPDDLFRLVGEEIGEDARLEVQVWEDGQLLQRSSSLERSDTWWMTTPEDADLRVLVDWIRVAGGHTDYQVSAELAGKGRRVMMRSGDTQTLELPAEARDSISASADYITEGLGLSRVLDVRITNAAGDVLATRDAIYDAHQMRATVWADETYHIRYVNGSRHDVEVLLMAKRSSPEDLGALADGVVSESSPRAVPAGDVVSYEFDVGADRYIEFIHSNDTGESATVDVFDGDGQAIMDTASQSPIWGVRGAGRAPFLYTEEPGEILVVLQYSQDVGTHQLRARQVAGRDLGTLGIGEEVTVTEASTIERGFSEFLAVSADEAMAVSAHFARGQGASSSCTIYDADTAELTFDSPRLGECHIGATLDEGGPFLARMSATEGDLSQVDARLIGMPLSEDFGTLGVDSTTTSSTLEAFHTGQVYSARVTVQAGQLLEVWHDSDSSQRARFRLLAEDGSELLSNNSFGNIASSNLASYAYWFADQETTLTVELTGGTRLAQNEVLTVSSTTIDDFGALAVGQTATNHGAQGLERAQRAFHEVRLDSPAWLEAAVSGATATTDVNLLVYDAQMNLQYHIQTMGEGADLSRTYFEAGDYLFVAAAADATPSYDLSVTRTGPPDYLSVPAATIPAQSQASDTIDVTGCTSVSDIEVYVDISSPGDRYLEITLESPSGAVVALHNKTGSFSEGELLGWYPADLTPHASLTRFLATSGDGPWTITVQNDSAYRSTLLDTWAMELTCS